MIFALSMFAITVFHCSCSLYSDIVYTLIKNILHNLKYFLKSSRFIAGDIEQKIVYTSIIHFHTNWQLSNKK